MTIFNLLQLVLVLVFSTESMAAPGGGSSPKVSNEYDERRLVLQWPTSFCNTCHCDYDQIPDEFKVHGLWFNKKSCPVKCNPSNSCIELDSQAFSQISGLREDMVKYWPNLRNQTYPENFWVYEYAKHGSCLPEFQNQVYYFKTALDLTKGIGIDTMRLSKGQTLQMGQSYQVKDFEPVTTANGTFFPSLRCNNAKGSSQLHEIVFCTDKHGKPKKCTSKGPRVCSGQFEFPQVPASSPSSSRSPPEMSSSPPMQYSEDGMDCSAIPRVLPLMQFIHFLSQIFLYLYLVSDQ